MQYWVDASDRLVEFDDEWCVFARLNGAESLADRSVLGRPLDSFISDRTSRAIWRRLLERVRSGRRFSLELGCDGPDRRRLLRVTPRLETAGTVCIESLLLSEVARQPVSVAVSAPAPGASFLVSCSWCNRYATRSGEWVEAEELLEREDPMSRRPAPSVTHGICSSCESRLEATG